MSATPLEELLDHIKRQDADFFRAKQADGVAVIWAEGAIRNKDRAEQSCIRDSAHRYKLSDTPAGKFIEAQKMGAADEAVITAAAHVRMAEAARGRVEVYAINAPENGTFRREILPAIFANKDISHINDQPRAVITRPTPAEQFNAIHASELARDMKIEDLLRDPAHPRSLYHGDVWRGPQPRPAGPLEADPHATPREVLHELNRLEADEIRRRKQERERGRENEHDRDHDRDR